MAFVGTAGFVLAKFAATTGIPFPLSPVLACLVAAALGIVVGIPALRIRGAQLAVVTLAAGVACEQFVFSNSALELQGTPVRSPHVFGISLAVRSGTTIRFSSVSLFSPSWLSAFLTMKIMAGRTGRAFLAVRANERSAAGCGIGVTSTKLIGFASVLFHRRRGGMPPRILGPEPVGELVYGHRQYHTVGHRVPGGITSFGGAIIAVPIAPLGVVYTFMSQTVHSGNYYAVLLGLGLILMAIFNPSGLAGQTRESLQRLQSRRFRTVRGEARRHEEDSEPVGQTTVGPAQGATRG